MTKFYSNGKLLITGEYLVLDGALALAVPTRFGQSLEVEFNQDGVIDWQAFKSDSNLWFTHKISINDLKEEKGNSLKLDENSPQNTLNKILQRANALNPEFLKTINGLKINTQLDFPNNWGLGSSSTLISNIAQLFKIDAFKLLEMTFGGSGYDIAAAKNDLPITYQVNHNERRILTSNFNPNFKDDLFFVHLNKKQNSRDSIKHYKATSSKNIKEAVEKASALTESIVNCESLSEFKLLIEIHETLISKIIKTPKIKSDLFPDYTGAVKSLGGWGGDFILATGRNPEKEYFRQKGYKTILPYTEMVL